jgi:hypothetical protein
MKISQLSDFDAPESFKQYPIFLIASPYAVELSSSSGPKEWPRPPRPMYSNAALESHPMTSMTRGPSFTSAVIPSCIYEACEKYRMCKEKVINLVRNRIKDGKDVAQMLRREQRVEQLALLSMSLS